jgi:hypothetical protein
MEAMLSYQTTAVLLMERVLRVPQERQVSSREHEARMFREIIKQECRLTRPMVLEEWHKGRRRINRQVVVLAREVSRRRVPSKDQEPLGVLVGVL